MAVEGTATGLNSHAAGVIIGDGHPLKQFIPLLYNTNMNQWSVQCNMVEAEEIGLLKMDFLGLNNLDGFGDIDLFQCGAVFEGLTIKLCNGIRKLYSF